MFEAGLSLSIYLVNSIAGSVYMQKFLRGRYPKKFALFAWTSLYFIIQSLVLERLNRTHPLNELVGMLVDIAVVLLLQMFLYKKDLSKQFFVTVSFVAGKEIIKYVVSVLPAIWCNIILFFVDPNTMKTSEQAEFLEFGLEFSMYMICILLYALMIITYLSVIGKKFIWKEYQLRTYEYSFLILPSIANLCISVTLKMMMISVENGIATTMFEKVPATMFWVPLICLLLLGVNISSVILLQKVVQLGEEERKRAILENQMAQMQREVEEIQDIYADMRGLRHDMRSHLESIMAVIRRTSGKDREELDNYIGKMETTISRLDFVYRTGNPITDVIIHQKKQEAKKRHISFEADFVCPAKQQIDVYDIGIVLNNALENAIEASSKAEGNKSISLRSCMKGNLFFIEVENDFFGELIIDSKTGLPVSSKEDKQLHGVGMENIQRCAKKYMGDIDITIRDMGDKKRFNLTIMMYQKYFTPQSS